MVVLPRIVPRRYPCHPYYYVCLVFLVFSHLLILYTWESVCALLCMCGWLCCCRYVVWLLFVFWYLLRLVYGLSCLTLLFFHLLEAAAYPFCTGLSCSLCSSSAIITKLVHCTVQCRQYKTTNELLSTLFVYLGILWDNSEVRTSLNRFNPPVAIFPLTVPRRYSPCHPYFNACFVPFLVFRILLILCVSGCVHPSVCVVGCVCVVWLLSVFWYLLRLVCGFSCKTLLFFINNMHLIYSM